MWRDGVLVNVASWDCMLRAAFKMDPIDAANVEMPNNARNTHARFGVIMELTSIDWIRRYLTQS